VQQLSNHPFHILKKERDSNPHHCGDVPRKLPFFIYDEMYKLNYVKIDRCFAMTKKYEDLSKLIEQAMEKLREETIKSEMNAEELRKLKKQFKDLAMIADTIHEYRKVQAIHEGIMKKARRAKA